MIQEQPLPTHTPQAIRDFLGISVGHRHRGNASGAAIYRIESPECGRCFLKALHSTGGGGLRREREKLEVLHSPCAPFAALPRVLQYEEVGDWSHLLLTAVPGATGNAAFRETPLRVARLLGRLLRRLHELPPDQRHDCLSIESLLDHAEHRISLRGSRPHGLHSLEGIRLNETPADRLKRLRALPLPKQQRHLVLTHGDFCLPNVLLDLSDRVGLIDVGSAAMADRHRDLALAVRSIRYSGGRADAVNTFLLWYGIDDVEEQRLRYWGDLLELI